MMDLTKPPYDKISHMAIDFVLTAIAILIALTVGWHWLLAYGSTMRGYFREQAQEWHMSQRSDDAYLPWKWRNDSLKDWISWAAIGWSASIILEVML